MSGNVVMSQDCVRFSEIYNIAWWPAVPKACHSRGEHALDNVKWVGGKEMMWTDQQVNDLFSKSCPTGLDNEMKSILDKGYTFYVWCTRNNVRMFYIEKQNQYGEPIDPENKRITGRAPNFSEALLRGIEIYKKTIGAGLDYDYDKWFGDETKPYPNAIFSSLEADSRLDGLFIQAGHEMRFRKAKGERYELEFKRDEPKKVTICFDKFAVC